jgi:hypothetical protein
LFFECQRDGLDEVLALAREPVGVPA